MIENKEKKEGYVAQMARRVHNGEMKTINEWAEEFEIEPRQLRSYMSRGRNKNKQPYHLYPMPNMQGQPGVVVDIMERTESFRSVMADYDNRVINHMLAGIKALEYGLKNNPQLMPFVREMLNDITSAMDDGSRTLLLKSKE